MTECLEDQHLWKEDDRSRVGQSCRLSCNADPRTTPYTDSAGRGALQSYPKLGQDSQAFIVLSLLVVDMGCHRKGSIRPGDPLQEGAERLSANSSSTSGCGGAWSPLQGGLRSVLQCPLQEVRCILENLNHLSKVIHLDSELGFISLQSP